MSGRENILKRIRVALGRAGAATTEERQAVEAAVAARQPGPQPAMPWETLSRFRERCITLTTTVDQVAARDALPQAVARYLADHDLPRSAVCWRELLGLDWEQAGVQVEARGCTGSDLVGITGAFCGIAETGTLMLLSSPDTAAATSLLPETHIAVLPSSRVLRTMEEAFGLLRKEHGDLPRAVNFVSGPSRTADIEQTVTLGAHGPYRVHVILVS